MNLSAELYCEIHINFHLSQPSLTLNQQPLKETKGTFNQMVIYFDTAMKHLQEAISQFRKVYEL